MPVKQPRILFVDDDDESLMLLKEYLEEEFGYAVEINAGMEIIDRLSKERFDLIGIDCLIRPIGENSDHKTIGNIHFEGVNYRTTGLEFFRRLRAGIFNLSHEMGTPKTVPVIFLSAFSLNEIQENKSTRIVGKPFRFGELTAIITQLLSDESQC